MRVLLVEITVRVLADSAERAAYEGHRRERLATDCEELVAGLTTNGDRKGATGLAVGSGDDREKPRVADLWDVPAAFDCLVLTEESPRLDC